MQLDFKKLNQNTKKQPMLRLRTLAGKELGVIPYVYDLHFTINYSDVSTIEFTTPYMVNGKVNPVYAQLTSYKVVYTDELGIYVLSSPSKSGDGMSETKTVTGYSLEQMFNTKDLYLEKGTYNFWNPATPTDTILNRILEMDSTWHVGYVAPRLIGCYRTFDEYDSDALSFCYGDAMEKYRCVFVFDVYNKSINVYDADEDAQTLPIYLNYKNLIESVDVNEIVDDFATKLHLYGSDNLTIRDVNPIGTDYIINLDYFIANGDLDVVVGDSGLTLAERVKEWESSIAAKQTYYAGLVSSRASLAAQKLTQQVQLTELQGEMATLTAQQSVTIQAISLETTDSGKQTQQTVLNNINSQISAKQQEIDAQQSKIDNTQSQIDSATESVKSVTSELAYSSYFTEAERKILDMFLIEGDLEEETFVATDVSSSASGQVTTISGSVSVTGSDIARVEVTEFNKTMYILIGGTVSINSAGITAEIVRGTMEVKSGGSYVFTGYLGKTTYNGNSYDSGLLTISGTYSTLSSDIAAQTVDEITEYKGTTFSFSTTDATCYFTVSVSDFQKYSVAMELYDFGTEALDDYAWPVYEFSVDSANFLYHEKFEPFKDKLELGKAVRLELGSDGRVTPKVIGVELDFDDITSFSLIFSNRYQRKSKTFSWIDEMRSVGRSSRTFNASKYIYNRSAEMSTSVDQFMSGTLDAAKNTILGATNQSVVIDGAGIHVGGESNYQMRIVDSMIAMTDDGWKTAKMAIGRFSSPETGEQWGINCELVAGKLIVGNNMVIQNPQVDSKGDTTGVMQFSVDSTGAWLYNSRIVLQSDKGRILIDPDYGIVAGTNLLFDTNGTTVTPSFVDSNGNITLDIYGMPENANFYLDMSGNAYLRGTIVAKSGKIGGFTISESQLHCGDTSGSYVGINGSSSGDNSAYAFWAGKEAPTGSKTALDAPFWVSKKGELFARTGTFSGTISGGTITGGTISGTTISGTTINGGTISGGTISGGTVTGSTVSAGTIGGNTLSGTLKADSGGWLVGCGIAVGEKNVQDGNGNIIKNNCNFYVDHSGNVTIKGGSIIFSDDVDAETAVSAAQSAASSASSAATAADAKAVVAQGLVEKLAVGEYVPTSGTTFISKRNIYSPSIYTNDLGIYSSSSDGKISFHCGSSDISYISYNSGTIQTVFGGSYSGAELYISFDYVTFKTGCTVTGLTATWG